jgi:hypothetical protein
VVDVQVSNQPTYEEKFTAPNTTTGCKKCGKNKSTDTKKTCKTCGQTKKDLAPYFVLSFIVLLFTIYGFVEAIRLVIGLFSK